MLSNTLTPPPPPPAASDPALPPDDDALAASAAARAATGAARSMSEIVLSFRMSSFGSVSRRALRGAGAAARDVLVGAPEVAASAVPVTAIDAALAATLLLLLFAK